MRQILFCIVILYNNLLLANIVYISDIGNDMNDGLSPERPWKTFKEFKRGNTYLLKRGEVFNFKIGKSNVKGNINRGKIVIDAYGVGEKPILSLYKDIVLKSCENYRNNIWKVNLSDSNNFSGFYDSKASNDVGFLKIDDLIYGFKFDNLDSLRSNGDFYSNGDNIYIYYNYEKFKELKSIKVACDNVIIDLSDDMEINNIQLTGCGGHGIRGENINNVKIKGVDVFEIGGAYLKGFKDGKSRYGNGIELWNGAVNCLIEKCLVYDIYDVAYTMQGNGKGIFKDVIFKYNKALNNEQSFEFWVQGWNSGFIKCKVYKNVFERAGFGWSHYCRPDKNVAVHILNYHWEVNASDLNFKKNIFRYAKSGYLYCSRFDFKAAPFKSGRNLVLLEKGVPYLLDYSSKYLQKIKSSDSSEQILKRLGLEVDTKFILN